MNRGDVILCAFLHSSQTPSKNRPAVVVQSDFYNQRIQNLLVALPFIGLFLGCDKIESSPSRMTREHSEPDVAAVRVTPIHPARKTLTRWIELPGQIDAPEQTPLYARVTGYV